jgi:hypothetical protein
VNKQKFTESYRRLEISWEENGIPELAVFPNLHLIRNDTGADLFSRQHAHGHYGGLKKVVGVDMARHGH